MQTWCLKAKPKVFDACTRVFLMHVVCFIRYLTRTITFKELPVSVMAPGQNANTCFNI